MFETNLGKFLFKPTGYLNELRVRRHPMTSVDESIRHGHNMASLSFTDKCTMFEAVFTYRNETRAYLIHKYETKKYICLF